MTTVLEVSVAVCLGYLLLSNGAYLVLAAIGAVENAIRRHETGVEDYQTLASSRFTIPVSVLVAAYNEETAIVSTVRSLLALHYPEHEVIVVNDGSTDGTLAQLREEFELEPYEMFVRRIVHTEDVRAVYRSDAQPNLFVVDKQNGGKADALNAGLNVARYRYVCGVDADTIFDPDALLKGMRLVVQDPARIVGVTSHLTIAEDPGRTMGDPKGRRRIDRRAFVAYQHLDYLRAFLNNRLAWSRLGFMLCSVGAFQIWRRDLLEELRGYARGFTCEDIELTFRVHEHFLRNGQEYAVLCLPDNVGTTEGPDTVRKLVSQRERWQRVIDETVWHYRKMWFNPRFKRVGLIGVPFYLVTEVLAPAVELLALFSLVLAVTLGIFSPATFALMLAAIAFLNASLTAWAIMLDDVQSRTYRRRDLTRLLLLAPLDLFLYRPIIVWARLKGSWRFLRGDKEWHKFERNVRSQTA
jgi:cellulose synthase/poly-beta-1,6-N-acetylglucosamine synthase-like glycosyltransferase